MVEANPFSGRRLRTAIREDEIDPTAEPQRVSDFVRLLNSNPDNIEPSGPSNILFPSDPPGRFGQEDTEFLNSLVPTFTGDWAL
jgi:hypothetical protein